MRGDEGVGARARPEVEHGVAGLDGGQVEHVADAREGRQRVGRHGVEPVARIAEALGDGPAELEVEVAVGLLGDFAVHRADVVAQLAGVDDGLYVSGHGIS